MGAPVPPILAEVLYAISPPRTSHPRESHPDRSAVDETIAVSLYWFESLGGATCLLVPWRPPGGVVLPRV
jgi:hypothetical protein